MAEEKLEDRLHPVTEAEEAHHHHHHHHDDEDGCCGHHHHHDHDEDECHDPNCTDPSHHHHHHHHHHDEAEREEVVDESLVLSRSRSITPEAPLSPQTLRERGERCFLRLGEMLGVDGIILGHIKGVIEAGDASLSLSMTRVGVVDVTPIGGWEALERVERFDMTVNIMSLVAAGIFEDDLFYGMDKA